MCILKRIKLNFKYWILIYIKFHFNKFIYKNCQFKYIYKEKNKIILN